MERTLNKDLRENIGKTVKINGWIQDFRNLSKIKFLVIRDRTGLCQAVALKEETPVDVFEAIQDFPQESVVEIEGVPEKSEQSRFGIELKIKKIKLISKSSTPLPIDNTDKSNTQIEKRIDYRFLDTRNSRKQAIFKVRSKIVRVITDFFDQNGFTNINTSKITQIGVESGAQLFEVNYFNDKMYLSQSPQVYKQMFVAGGFERVYEIGAVFRAEKSHTTRHLTEFTGIDMEMGFINNEHDVMDVIENMFKYLLTELPKHAKEELNMYQISYSVPEKMPRIDMREAKKMLAEKGKKYSEDDDLDAEGEKILGQIIKEKYNSDFVFVTNFPWVIRPFYHMKPENDPKGTKSFDLLYKGVEIATGAQREHRLEILEKQAEEKGLSMDEMEKYKEIFMYGIPPHGGVGFGLDRITQRLLELDNVREAVLLPRDPERKTP